MRTKEIEAMLEDDGFDLQEDTTDALGYGSKTYVRNDGEELVQVITSVEKAEN